MHPVGGLLDDHAATPVDDVIGDFLATAGGEAVHEEGVGAVAHQRGVDLIGAEGLLPLEPLLFLPHARPDVGVDGCGVLDGRDRVGRLLDLGIGEDVAEVVAEGLVKLEALGSGEDKPHSQQATDDRQRPGDVVAVADKRQRQAGEPADMGAEGVEIGEGLAGMAVVGEAVDHRHARDGGERLNRLVGLRAADDDVDVFTEHPAEVGDALAR